jgi:serine/threonine-protein phosphatase 6 regulatory ankyrin repeat subunit B
VNARNDKGVTALMATAFQPDGKPDIVRVLIAAGADVNANQTGGGTALMFAAMQGHGEIVQALLAAKADVNAITKKGNTALLLATQKNHPDIVLLLKNAGAVK